MTRNSEGPKDGNAALEVVRELHKRILAMPAGTPHLAALDEIVRALEVSLGDPAKLDDLHGAARSVLGYGARVRSVEVDLLLEALKVRACSAEVAQLLEQENDLAAGRCVANGFVDALAAYEPELQHMRKGAVLRIDPETVREDLAMIAATELRMNDWKVELRPAGQVGKATRVLFRKFLGRLSVPEEELNTILSFVHKREGKRAGKP